MAGEDLQALVDAPPSAGLQSSLLAQSEAQQGYQTAEQELENYESSSAPPAMADVGPPPQNQLPGVMQSSPYLLAMIALGGKVMGASGQTMLGATNGMMQGLIQGSHQQYQDASQEYDAAWKRALQHWQAQQTAYKQGLAMYKGRVDQKLQALQFARQAVNDQRQATWDDFQKHVYLDQIVNKNAELEQRKDQQKMMNYFEQQKLDLAKEKAGGAGGMGSRAEQQFDRIVQGAAQVAQSLHNVMKLPIESDTGWFSSGHTGSILDASKNALANTVTSQEVQDYKVLSAGIQRNLSAIEAAGLAPSGSLTHQMDAIVLQQGDSQLTKLRKMAEARQIVEQGTELYMNSPKVSPAQKQYMQQIYDKLKEAVPFTQDDLTALEQSKNPRVTINDVAAARGLIDRSGQGQSQQSPPTATGPNGEKVVLKDGQWVPLGQ